jgi:CBS domain-containing protein
MKVSEIMSSPVIKINPEDSGFKALEIMIRENIRRILVGKAEGILTLRDLVYNWKELGKAVKEIMIKDIHFVNPNLDVKEVARIMAKEGIGSLVVGDGENIMGIVTERDVIRYLKAPKNSKVVDIMSKDPLLTTRDSNIGELIEFMKSKWFRHVIVVEGKFPIGIISVKDIGRLLLTKRDLNQISASHIMSSPVIKTFSDSTLESARLLMCQRNIGYLPVTDPDGLVGYVSEKEMIAALAL